MIGMKFLFFNVETKKELRAEITRLNNLIKDYEGEKKALQTSVDKYADKVKWFNEKFPLFIGQVVYDVALRSEKGKYTKKNASLEHSVVTAVTVTEKNYFGLVGRLATGDVHLTVEAAEAYLKSVCVTK